ncbi:MAG TPA: flagellar hook-associated protein FlgK [Burkholderiaceae bacterium]|jgi:flagellar hook-associated protein 1 FlgK|nr:flagellar hook-associated protein FlgK [Burkholderiaceae bacterium]
MSTSALMSLGTRAMFASYAQLQTTSQNIANANVEGYSRQQVELKTAMGQYTGAGFFGKGVDVATVSRSYDSFLTKEAASTVSASFFDQARLDQLKQLENVFSTGTDGIGYAANQFLNAMSDVANNPQDASARQVVLTRAQDLATHFASAGGQLDTLQSGVTQDLKNSVTTVNGLTQQIAKVNGQIAAVQGAGHTPNDLLDQRDQLISQLSQYLQVTTIPADDGTLGVFIAGGQRLVLGSQALQMQAVPDTYDPARMGLAIVEANGTRTLPSDMLTGGSIAGLISFQNKDLQRARDLLGQMAAALSARVNEQQALGLDLSQPSGAGAPIFSVGAPQALPASSNAKDASGNYLTSVALTVTDASQLQASDYELRADPSGAPGAYELTRLSDGLVRTIASGDVVDGVRIDIGPPAPSATDRFLLQPVARAVNGMQVVLDDPRGIAAASPVTATLGAANTGTASVASLRAVSPTINPSLTADITFTNNNGDYSWTLSDGTSGTGTWTPGQPIALNGFELQLNGVPKSGDTLNVSKTLFPASNNGNALAMVALRDESLVGRTLQASGTLVGGTTITDAYADAIADIGVRVQSAKSSASISGASAAAAEQARSAKAGVNLDEEAARLIQYQQNYQAAAKVLQVAQQLFDKLLEVAGA